LLEALEQINDPRVKLIVVGGREYLIKAYEKHASARGLTDRVRFVGFQTDVRPYLWASDLFVFPSTYEVFPLVSLEAAAAGLPLLVSSLHGVEEFLRDGVNGWCVTRDAQAYADKLRYALSHPEQVRRMGRDAALSVAGYRAAVFGDQWRQLYNRVNVNLPTRSSQSSGDEAEGPAR